ncbi:Protein quaking [Labeo rohita]|uniref:Protein quaking n=1 Tax=Labeo rohita TaxID=84645 RepID=A0ABQ8M4K1_LABRO|nr:Protein quaking [Labeo rohita]
MVGEMETKEKPKPTPDYLMQLMNDKKLMSSLPNFCGIFNHLERLLDEGNVDGMTRVRQISPNRDGNGARVVRAQGKQLITTIYGVCCLFVSARHVCFARHTTYTTF